jgi:hypothetical protein
VEAELGGTVGDLGRRRHAAQRDAAAEALRRSDDVRHDVEVLDGEPATGAADAGLRLVDDHQGAGLVAPFAQRLHVGLRRDDHPADAHHDLEDDRRGGAGRGPVDDVEALVEEAHVVAVRRVLERAPVGVGRRDEDGRARRA